MKDLSGAIVGYDPGGPIRSGRRLTVVRAGRVERATCGWVTHTRPWSQVVSIC